MATDAARAAVKTGEAARPIEGNHGACGSEGRRGACGRRGGQGGAFGYLEGCRGAFIHPEEERAPVAAVSPLAVVSSTARCTLGRRDKQQQDAGVRRNGRRCAFGRHRK